MTQVVVMVEEPSMGIVANSIARKLGISDTTRVIPHEGKNDLENSFPRKLRAWSGALAPRFVICRDNDGGDCIALKHQLAEKVPAGRSHPVKFRIVMQELESWYFGDLAAIEEAGLLKAGQAAKLAITRKFRDPDILVNAKHEFQKLVKRKGQLELARMISPHMDLKENRSVSFGHFVDALKWAAGR